MTPWRVYRMTLIRFWLALLLLAPGLEAAAAQVEAVTMTEREKGVVVTIQGAAQLEHRLLTRAEPPRVTLQLLEGGFEGVDLPKGGPDGLIRAIRVKGRDSRQPQLVLDLNRSVSARATKEGQNLRIALNPRTSQTEMDDNQARKGNGHQQARITDYQLRREGGRTILFLETDGEVADSRSFQPADRPILVVDIEGTGLDLRKRKHSVDHPFIDEIRFGEQGDRTRMVVALSQEVAHTVKSADGGLRVEFAPPSAAQAKRRIEKVDFTIGDKPGTGRVTLDMDRSGANVRVEREKGRVILDLPSTRLPERLAKRLDVRDFGTALYAVDLYQKGDAARVVASGKAPLKAQTYQIDDRLVLDVRHKQPTEAGKRGPKATGKPYEGEELSLNFQDIRVRQALQILADFAKINIITSDSVGGSLTLRLNDVPWDQALDLVLASQGLGMERNGDVIRVAPQAELQQQRQQELKAELQKEKLVPLETELIPVNYAKAAEMKALLKAQSGSGGSGPPGQGAGGILSQRGSVSVDERTNTLILRDTPEQISKVKKLVEELDRPTKQVMIKARIVKVDTNSKRSLGIKWGGQYSKTTNYRFPNSIQASGTLAGAQAGAPDLAVNLPATGAGGQNAASLGFSLGHIANNATLDMELQAIETEGHGKVISSPKVVTANQQEASIKQGQEIPFQEATSSGATNVSFKEAVLKLGVTPQITPDGRLILDVQASNDSVAQQTAAGPAIDTEQIKTQVLVDNGETIVIGGIYAKTKRKDVTGVPGFRHIPLLGWLFENKTTKTEKRELLVFLTPRIIGEDSLAGNSRRTLGGRHDVATDEE